MELFPFQKIGAEWLSSKKLALLADEMGLGKSAQAIHAADLVGAERICVVCPAVARVNWGREFEKFSVQQRKFQIIQKRSEQIARQTSTIISYDLLVSNIYGIDAEYDALILDEVHFVKSLEAKRVKAVLGRNGVVRRAKRVWALSATPAPNDVSELWGLLYTFGVTGLKQPAFVERYCETVDTNFGRRVIGNKHSMLPEFRAILAPIMLRRKKEEVMKQLPPITYNSVTVEPGEVEFADHQSFCLSTYPIDRRQDVYEQIAKQEKLVTDIFAAKDAARGTVSTENATNNDELLKIMEGLAGSISTLRKYQGLQKVGPALELISAELKAKAYKKIVIFAIHVDVVVAMREGLKDFGVVTLYGGTPPEKRQKNIDAFQSDHPRAPRVFIGNIQAAGTAITLTASNQVVFLEQSWVPGDNAQAAMRCHRIGQERPVFVRYLSFGRGTLDARISGMCARKTKNLLEVGL